MSHEYTILSEHLIHAALCAGALLIVAMLAFLLEQGGRRLRLAGLSPCVATVYSAVALVMFTLDITVVLLLAIRGLLSVAQGIWW